MPRLVIATLAALLLSACDGRVSEVAESDPTVGTSSIAGPPSKIRLPFVLEQNLEVIYERAVTDFASYEIAHRNPEWPTRTFRLDHRSGEVEIWGDGGFDTIPVPPGAFDGIEFDTALGDDLLNADEPFPTRPENPVRTISVRRICVSQPMKRIQISLGWADTISESWTFLYDLTHDGQLQLKKSIMLGCNTPDGWIDGPF
jgi:hypothetical protein